MKVRSRFVANSSTGNFVVIGVKLFKDYDWEDIDAKLNSGEEKNYDLSYFTDENIVGTILADLDEYDEVELTFIELAKKMDSVAERLGKLNIIGTPVFIAKQFSI